MVSAEVSGVFKVDFTPHNSKVKSHLKFTELDINASQACNIVLIVSKIMNNFVRSLIKSVKVAFKPLHFLHCYDKLEMTFKF